MKKRFMSICVALAMILTIFSSMGAAAQSQTGNISLLAGETDVLHKINLTEAKVMRGTYPTSATINEDAIGTVFNGDINDDYVQPKQKRMYIDLGYEVPISEIVICDNKTLGTLCVWSSNTNPSLLSSFDYKTDTNPNGFKQILRTNGIKYNGVNSSYTDLTKDEAVYGRKATATGVSAAVGNIRYLAVGDWSNEAHIAELEVYVENVQYNISVEATSGAEVTAVPKAYVCDDVSVSVTAAQGAEVSGLSIKDSDGADVEYTAKGGGVYEFEMPPKDVTIKAKTKSATSFATKTKFTGMPDTSLTSNSVQLGTNGQNKLMIGRGRISLIKLDLSNVDGIIDNAVLNLTKNAGVAHSIAIFYMPNNEWTEDVTKGNDITFDGTTKLTAMNGVSLYATAGKRAVFPDAVLADTGNDVKPDNTADQDAAALSASKGILKDYFYGDIIKAGESSADISATVRAAIAANPAATEITLMLYTPYTFAQTLDFYSKDYAGATEEQKPSWTVNEKTPVAPEEFSYEFGKPVKTAAGVSLPVTVSGQGSQKAVIYAAEYVDNLLVSVGVKKEVTIDKSESIDIACSLGENTTVKVYVWDEEQRPLSDGLEL